MLALHGVDIDREAPDNWVLLGQAHSFKRSWKEAERAFVSSCDSPLLEAELISQLLELSHGHDAAIPFVDGHYVPTTAIYAKSILPAAVRLLDRGELRPRLLIQEPGVRVIREDEITAADPELHSFRDCDTPEDYQDLLRLAGLSYAPGR